MHFPANALNKRDLGFEAEVHFVKVKGHSNDKYNDMADQLAKKALGIL